jgi:rhodanese-related sulfurtransferase
MSKLFRFLLLLLLWVLIIPSAAPLARESDDDEVDVVADLLRPSLFNYWEHMPEDYWTIRVDAFRQLLAENDDVVILDVRQSEEIEEFGVIEGAINIPLRELGNNLDLLPDLDATIVVVCGSGFKATIATTALHILGYENARVLVGGFTAWTTEDLPVVEMPETVEAVGVPEAIHPLLTRYVANYLENLPEDWGAVRPVDLFAEMAVGHPDFILDVRSLAEWGDPGHIAGASNIWINDFLNLEDQWPDNFDAEIVVYCGSSYRGGIVMTTMGLLGYTHVRNLLGGVNAWVAAELPLESG